MLEIRDLSLCFKNKKLIQSLSFSLQKGERITITGKSGCGKTTLLKCIMGFVQPDLGAIFIRGTELTEKNIWLLRQEIGYVPQEPDLGDQVTEKFIHQPFLFKANQDLSWDKNRLREFFRTFHLEEDLLQKKSTLLSGGEKQRIALVSALMLERDLYLLDEVTSALDDETRKTVIDYLAERRDLSLLFVTHDKDIKAMSHKTCTLRKEEGLRIET